MAGVAIGATLIVGSQVYIAEQARKTASKARDLQSQAQHQALTTSLRAEREAQIANNEAHKKTPNIAAILAAAQTGNQSPTNLTGANGANGAPLGLQPNKLGG